MSQDKGPRKAPSELVGDINRRIQALADAVHEAKMMHKRAGNPIAIWRDGRVQIIAPEDIPDESLDPKFV